MRKRLPRFLVLLFLAAMAQGSAADTASAQCEVHHNGDRKPEASGHCQFSQRQGYIDIRLKNNAQWSLSPAGPSNTYRDQKGAEVKRHFEGQTHVYKWHDRTIKLTFGGGHHKSHKEHHANGHTPRDLQDLVGKRGGNAEDQLQNRGYRLANSSTSGRDVYSNWHHQHGGQCVSVHSVDGHYKSIVYVPQDDCRKR